MGEAGGVQRDGRLRADVRGLFSRAHALLLLGGVLWWTCHYALLWNGAVAETFTTSNGSDLRFLCTLVGTVITLVVVAALARVQSGMTLSSSAVPILVYASLTAVSLALMVACVVEALPVAAGLAGAVVSGVGNSLALVFYGELHARLSRRLEPLSFAVEMGAGALLSLAVLRLPAVAWGATCATLAIGAAMCLLMFCRRTASGQSDGPEVAQPSPVTVDITFAQLLVLCALTGVTYGLMRTFAGGQVPGGPAGEFGPEQLGSLLCAAVLVAVWALQGRASMFDQCLFAAVPFVATGMLLVSLTGASASIAATINTCGFACFFALLWYFAAIMATPGRSLTLCLALLLCVSQACQLLGALVPAPFVNALSNVLMYLIFAATLVMFWRDRGRIPAAAAAVERQSESSGEPGARDLTRWERDFGLSSREAQVAALLVRRTPYRQIAETLDVTENTVKTHVRNIYKKAGVASREELLVRLGTEDGHAR